MNTLKQFIRPIRLNHSWTNGNVKEKRHLWGAVRRKRSKQLMA